MGLMFSDMFNVLEKYAPPAFTVNVGPSNAYLP